MSTSTGRGTEEALAGLHGMLAEHFRQRLASGEALPPAELNAIRQFLKDNGIDCMGGENPVLTDITQNLPSFGEDDGEGVSLLN